MGLYLVWRLHRAYVRFIVPCRRMLRKHLFDFSGRKIGIGSEPGVGFQGEPARSWGCQVPAQGTHEGRRKVVLGPDGAGGRWLGTSLGATHSYGDAVTGFSIGVFTCGVSAWIPACAGISVLSVKDFQVVGTGDCRMRRLLPTQAGDKPLASRSLRPRYIFLPSRGLKFFE